MIYQIVGFTTRLKLNNPSLMSQYDQLVDLFLEWNQKINLSAIRDEAGVREKHIVDSLLATEFVDFEDKRVLDIGAGGGFPTLPLAIECPTAHITALDSVGKKMKVVQSMADKLGLENVKTMHGRIEDFAQNKTYREKYDIVTARALAPWPTLLEYALPFLRIGGVFVAYQGPQIKEDLKTYKNLEQRLGGKIIDIHETALSEAARVFVVVKKIKPTAKMYPRPNNLPRLKPLS
jgi:16S rRNA (guanine527-N7)-methyltransferase